MIPEKAYLVLFSVCTGIASIIFLTLAINGFIEYNLGINIFTSLVTTVITVIFLSVFLIMREEREWKTVKKAVYSKIETELSLLFAELLRLTENEMEEIVFKYSLLNIKDAKIRKEMIFSKLAELQKKEPLQLNPASFSIFRTDKELLTSFLDVKKNLGDVQIRYGRHLTSKITEKLIKLQDLLELMNMAYKTDIMWNKLQGQMPLLGELMHKLMPSQTHDQKLSSVDLMQNILPTCMKSLIQEIFDLWKMGIEFDLA